MSYEINKNLKNIIVESFEKQYFDSKGYAIEDEVAESIIESNINEGSVYPKTIAISAKCTDLFQCTITNNDGSKTEYEGYAPNFMGDEYGDYVNLNIDIETGKIIGWDPANMKNVIGQFASEINNKDNGDDY